MMSIKEIKELGYPKNILKELGWLNYDWGIEASDEDICNVFSSSFEELGFEEIFYWRNCTHYMPPDFFDRYKYMMKFIDIRKKYRASSHELKEFLNNLLDVIQSNKHIFKKYLYQYKELTENEKANPKSTIYALELSTRARNCLLRAGYITTVNDLKFIHLDDLQKITNCGDTTVNEIVSKVKDVFNINIISIPDDEQEAILEKEKFAKDFNAPIWLLNRLSEDESCSIRYAVVCNPNCTRSILEKLAYDEDINIRQAVVKHKNTPKWVLDKLSYDINYNVRTAARIAINKPESAKYYELIDSLFEKQIL